MRWQYTRTHNAKVAKSVDALVLGASGATLESSSLSFRTIILEFYAAAIKNVMIAKPIMSKRKHDARLS